MPSKMAAGKKKSGKGAPSKTGSVPFLSGGAQGSTKSVLDRYGPIGALYARRTETSGGITVLQEVGIPRPDGKVQFYSLIEAEVMLTSLGQSMKVQPKAIPNPVPKVPKPVSKKPVVPQFSTGNPFSALEAELPAPTVQPTKSVTSWADEVIEEAESSRTAAQRAVKKTRSPSPSKKGKSKKVNPQPKVEVDLEKRCASRLGVSLAWLKSSIQGPALARAMQVLDMSQKNFSLFLVSDEAREYCLFRDNAIQRFRAPDSVPLPKGKGKENGTTGMPQPEVEATVAEVDAGTSGQSPEVPPPSPGKPSAGSESRRGEATRVSS